MDAIKTKLDYAKEHVARNKVAYAGVAILGALTVVAYTQADSLPEPELIESTPEETSEKSE